MSNWKIVRPRKGINRVSNPSFETGTTGWTTDGSNTIAQSSDASLFGNYSLKATYQNDLDLANYTVTLDTSTTHVVSAYVYIPSDWDGGGIRFEENVGGAGGSVVQNTNTVTTTGVWQRIYYIVTTGSAGTDMFTIEAASAPTAGKFIYIDGAQIQPASTLGTYIDGDQVDCSWYGSPHASESLLIYSRKGGEILDFADDLGLYVQGMQGTGSPPVRNISTTRALLPGAEYQRSNFMEATFALQCAILGSSLSNFHAQRQLILEYFSPEGITDADPILLQYEGSDETKEILCVYQGGLELTGPTGFSERPVLQFKAMDWPFFQQIGQTSVALDTSDSSTIDNILARVKYSSQLEDGLWNNLGATSAQDDLTVRTYSQILDGYVYVGGEFTSWQGNSGWDYIVRYDINNNSWSNVGGTSVFNSWVRELLVGPDGLLYICGNFTDISVAANDYIVTWDGSSWATLGTPSVGTGSYVDRMAFDRDGNLWVVGFFTDFAGVSNADGAAVWDGSSWSTVPGSPGWGDDVFCLAVDSQNRVWMCGEVGADVHLKRFEGGTTWTDFGTVDLGAGDGYMNEILIDSQDRVFFGGRFDSLASVSGADNIAYYDNGQFYAVDYGGLLDTNDEPERMAFDDEGNLWITGNFQYGNFTDRIAMWNGDTWLPVDINLPSTGPGQVVRNISGSMFWGGNSNGNVTMAAKTTVTNRSNMRVYPVITIHRSGGTSARIIKLENFTTNKQLWMDYSMLDNETITIDFTPGNRSVESDFLGPVWDVLPPSDLAEFFLVPGDNEIIAYVLEVGSPTMTSFLSYRASFLGVD